MTLHAKNYLDTCRAGQRLRTTPTNPHTQLDQNAPLDLQERVFEIASHAFAAAERQTKWEEKT